MGKFQTEVERLIKQGAQKATQLQSTANVRSLELNNLHKGDIITIPENWKDNILVVPIRGSKDEDGNQMTTECIMLEVQRGKSTATVQFYPSFFTKVRNEVKKTGDAYDIVGVKTASGNVVDEIQNFVDMNDAIDSLINRPFEVKDLVAFKTFRFGTTTPQNATVPVFEFK